MPEFGQTPGSFAALLRTKGFTSWTALRDAHPDVVRMAIRLNGTPHRVAPNAAQVELLAQTLRLPLAEVQAFAKGPPLSEAQLGRVARRSAHPGGYGRTNFKSVTDEREPEEPVIRRRKHTKHRTHVAATKRTTSGHRGKLFLPKRGSFGALMQAQGVPSWPQLADRMGSKAGMSAAKDLHRNPERVARNNPALQPIADALGVPLKTVAAFARGELLDDARIKAVQIRLVANAAKAKRAEKTTKGVVLGTVHVSAGRALQRADDGNGPSNGHAKKKGRPVGAKTNKLRGADVEVREIARTFYTTYNLAVMHGHDVFPPVPLEQMGVFLREFLGAKGITIAAMLDPNFKDAFDV